MTHLTMSAGDAARLVDAAKGKRPADLLFRGAQLANVYSGEIYPADVAVSEERIAYVGPRAEKLAGKGTRVIDVRGKTLVPGYVEPHAHPWVIYNPVSFAQEILPRGTTTLVYDNLFFFQLCPPSGFDRMVEDVALSPMSIFWTARLISQTTDPHELGRFTARRIRQLLKRPEFIATAEVTRWLDVWKGRPNVLRAMTDALQMGKPVEGHTAGDPTTVSTP